MTESGFQIGYLYRYLTQLRFSDVYVNFKESVEINISNGSYNVESGYYINVFAGSKDFIFQKTVRGAFPPANMKFDYPNQLLNATLADFAVWVQKIKLDTPVIATTASAFYKNAEFMQDLYTVFETNESVNQSWFITAENGECTITKTVSTGRKDKVIAYASFVRADWPETGARLLSRATTRTEKEYAFDPPIGRDTSADIRTEYGVSNNLFANEIILAKCGNNGSVWIPLVRCSNNTFVGSGSDVSGNIFYVTIAQYKVYRCFSVAADGTRTEQTITSLSNTALN